MSQRSFDDIPAEPVKREWVPDPDDPFDTSPPPDYSNPDYVPEHKLKISDDPTYKLIKKNKALFKRKTVEHYSALGYFVHECETMTVAGYGENRALYHHDLYGLYDMIAWKGLETIGIQITSKNNLGAHVTKACEHKPVGEKDKTWRATWLRRWLEAGRLSHLIGFYQPNGKGGAWKHEVRSITLAQLDEREKGKEVRR